MGLIGQELLGRDLVVCKGLKELDLGLELRKVEFIISQLEFMHVRFQVFTFIGADLSQGHKSLFLVVRLRLDGRSSELGLNWRRRLLVWGKCDFSGVCALVTYLNRYAYASFLNIIALWLLWLSIEDYVDWFLLYFNRFSLLVPDDLRVTHDCIRYQRTIVSLNIVLVDWHGVPCVYLLLPYILRMRLNDAMFQLHIGKLLRNKDRRTGLSWQWLWRCWFLQDDLCWINLSIVGVPLFLRKVNHLFLRSLLDQALLRMIVANVLMMWLLEDVAFPELAVSVDLAELLQMRVRHQHWLCLRISLKCWLMP